MIYGCVLKITTCPAVLSLFCPQASVFGPCTSSAHDVILMCTVRVVGCRADVQCLTLHVPGECALFDMKDLMTLGSKLPAHVTMVRFRLDSTHGTADIMKDAPRAVDNVPGELRPAHLALRNALRHAAQMMSSGVLAKLPAHVTVVCVEVVSDSHTRTYAQQPAACRDTDRHVSHLHVCILSYPLWAL